MENRWRISFALALTAMTTLMLELQLMRVFDAILQQNLAYMVITGAMFAFGLSGVYATLWPLREGTDVSRFLAKLSIGFGAFALLLLPVVNVLPFDFDKLRTEFLQQLMYFGVLYFALLLPFFLSGLIFTTVFSSYASNIRSLYFFDLCGAALGCVIFIPFIPRIGPGGVLFAVAGLNLLAATLFLGRTRWVGQAAAVAGLALIAIPFLRTEGYIDFREKMDKRGVMQARAQGDVVVTRWDPIAKIDVVNSYAVNVYGKDAVGERGAVVNRLVAYDGGTQASRLYPFDGNYAALREQLDRDLSIVPEHFWNRTVIASHWLKADSDADVLIIGSAAGQETKGALLYNPRSVDAIEMVRAVVELSRDDFGPYIGNIFTDPRVNAQVGEGRNFLRSSDKQYDIIQIFSNHTSSSMAAGSGVSAPVYLQTVEAYLEYFAKLKPDGILHINHHVYPRMIAAAAAAWQKLGRDNFRRHVVVYEQRPWDNIPLVLIKMSPWTEDEMARLDGFMARPGHSELDSYVASEHPLRSEGSFLTDEFYSGNLSADTIARTPYRVQPATDDRPFFNFLRKSVTELESDRTLHLNSATASLLNAQLSGTMKIPMDVIHWVVTGSAALFFAVLCIMVPLLFADAGRARWPGEFTSLFYFACLGAGFIIIELTLIHIFMKFIGYPLYTYSLVLFTVLLAAGVGSQFAEVLRISPSRRWWVPFAGTLLFGVLLWLVHPVVFHPFMAAGLGVRLAVAMAMMFPMAFFMGMALPIGILAIENKPRGAIAWAWGMNGLFTTIGGIGSGIAALFLGFRVTLAVGLGIYVLAMIAFRRLSALSAGRALGVT